MRKGGAREENARANRKFGAVWAKRGLVYWAVTGRE